jgi:hypothetical protein
MFDADLVDGHVGNAEICRAPGIGLLHTKSYNSRRDNSFDMMLPLERSLYRLILHRPVLEQQGLPGLHRHVA